MSNAAAVDADAAVGARCHCLQLMVVLEDALVELDLGAQLSGAYLVAVEALAIGLELVEHGDALLKHVETMLDVLAIILACWEASCDAETYRGGLV